MEQIQWIIQRIQLTIRMRQNDAYCADATRTDHVPAVGAWCETIQDTARNLIYTSALYSKNSRSTPPLPQTDHVNWSHYH